MTLSIIGNLNIDLLVNPVVRFPDTDEELIVDSARVELAGTAGYALLACKALEVETFPVSTIGGDSFGEDILRTLRLLDIRSDGVSTLPDHETPLSIVFVQPDGSRSILSTLGAHAEMSVDIALQHDEDVRRSSEVLICGSYLLPQFGPGAIRAYVESIHRRGQLIVFDPSWDPKGWGPAVRHDTIALLPFVDVYMPNSEELRNLTGCATWQEAARSIGSLPGELVVKLGANGACFVNGDSWIEVPGYDVQATNTIGAGDVFDMAYLYARRRNWNPRRRLEFACAYAAIVVAQGGARRYPTVEEVLDFLSLQHGKSFWIRTGPEHNAHQ